jgi:hypothetical protein
MEPFPNIPPIFLLTPSIQYNKFETIEEIENESGS